MLKLAMVMAMQVAATPAGAPGSIPFAELARFADWREDACRVVDQQGTARIEMGSHLSADAQRTMYDVVVFRTRADLGMPVGTQVVSNGLFPQNGRVISIRNGWTSVVFDGRIAAALWYDDSATVTFLPVGERGTARLGILSVSSNDNPRAALADMIACHEAAGL